MDNDNKVKKILASIYRDARFAVDYKPMGVKNEKGGNELIKEKLLQGDPLMVCRFGAVEMHCVSRWMNPEKCSDEERAQALFAAGIFPNTDEMIGSFCSVYTETKTDVGGGKTHCRVLCEFTWESSAKKISTIIGDQK